MQGGEIIILSSDLGGGKTALTKGLVAGSGCDDIVQSPTFTISREYRPTNKKFRIAHYDFYRLDDPGIIKMMISESIEVGDVVVVEWADIISSVLPSETIKCNIVATADNQRVLNFDMDDKFEYLFRKQG